MLTVEGSKTKPGAGRKLGWLWTAWKAPEQSREPRSKLGAGTFPPCPQLGNCGQLGKSRTKLGSKGASRVPGLSNLPTAKTTTHRSLIKWGAAVE